MPISPRSRSTCAISSKASRRPNASGRSMPRAAIPAAPKGLRRLLLAIIRDLRVVFILLARQLVEMRAAGEPARGRAPRARAAHRRHPCAARQPARHLAAQVGARGSRVPLSATRRLPAHRAPARRAPRRSRKLDRRSRNRRSRRRWPRPASRPISPDARSTSIRSGARCRRRASSSPISTTCARCACSSTTSPTAMPRSASCIRPGPYVAGEFDDYIASPKGNHYQSLHTAVDRPARQDARSADPHARDAPPRRARLRRALALQGRRRRRCELRAQDRLDAPACSRARTRAKTTRGDAALLAGFRTEVIEDRVYLLTPKGQVIDLPRGATVLDFAYAIHTDVGHRCRGAKVNGRIVPLTFQPASGDRVEILTGKTIEPRRDWLSPHHGYLATHRAREKVRTWFKRVDHAQNLAAGRALLDRELKRLALHHANMDALPATVSAAHAGGTARSARARRHLARARSHARCTNRSRRPRRQTRAAPAPPRAPTHGRDAIVIEGVGNLMTQLARVLPAAAGRRGRRLHHARTRRVRCIAPTASSWRACASATRAA